MVSEMSVAKFWTAREANNGCLEKTSENKT